jgi:NAD(P)-dependent dehydrogenase (short-subunit alcohol dehydrogenase family)
MGCTDLLIWSLIVVVVYFVVRKLISRLRIDRYTDVYVLITGCDTGFGNEAAKRFDRMGCHVFAGCFTENGKERLKQECSDRLHAISLDVSNTESIQETYDYIKSNLPKNKGLWGVINNAAVNFKLGPVEWLSVDDYRKVLDVNLYGVINVTMTFLPLIKKARGRVVNIASILGRFSMPLVTPYSLSKFGVEAFTDGLRRSMRPWGVKAVVIEPGFHKTAVTSAQMKGDRFTVAWNGASSEAKEEYGKGFLKDVLRYTVRLLNLFESERITDVVDVYEEAVLGRFPRARYPVGRDCSTFFLPAMALPEWIGDWLMTIIVKPPKPDVLK